MTEQMQLLLASELQLLKDARDVLLYSYNKCNTIGIKESYELGNYKITVYDS